MFRGGSSESMADLELTRTTDPLFPPWRAKTPARRPRLRHTPLIVPPSMYGEVKARLPVFDPTKGPVSTPTKPASKKVVPDVDLTDDVTSSSESSEYDSDDYESSEEESEVSKKDKGKAHATSEDVEESEEYIPEEDPLQTQLS